MSSQPSANDQIRNRILCNIEDDDLDTLRPYLVPIELERRSIIHEPNTRIEHVYFIESGLVSRLARTPRDGFVEVSTVGRSGFVGIGFALGTMLASHRTVVLVPGRALRINVRELAYAVKASPALKDLLLRYVQTLFTMTAQLALCNARHVLDQRLVRWMLLAQDRLDGDTLPVTQEELAMLLGVRRAGISELLAEFEAEGLIRRVRGAFKIVSRAGLEKRGCECAAIIGKVYNGAFPPYGSRVQMVHSIWMSHARR